MTEVERSGRLVTMRVIPPVEDGRAGVVAQELRAAIIAAGTVVVCADLSAARAFSPETTERFIALMRSDNAKLERSAILLAPSATAALQIERMVREANHPARKTFRARVALQAWLGEVLNDEERAALQRFLAQAAAP